MNGVTAKCLGKHPYGRPEPCGWSGYVVLDKSPFKAEDGVDYLGQKVKCRRCGHVYYLMPAPTFMEPREAEGEQVSLFASRELYNGAKVGRSKVA